MTYNHTDIGAPPLVGQDQTTFETRAASFLLEERAASNLQGDYLANWRKFYATPSDRNFATTSFADVLGLGVSVAAGERWMFDIRLPFQTGNSTQIGLGINGPAASELLVSAFTGRAGNGSLVSDTGGLYNTNVGASISAGSDSGVCDIKVVATFTSSGTFIPRAARTIGGGFARVKAPATIQAQRLS